MAFNKFASYAKIHQVQVKDQNRKKPLWTCKIKTSLDPLNETKTTDIILKITFKILHNNI